MMLIPRDSLGVCKRERTVSQAVQSKRSQIDQLEMPIPQRQHNTDELRVVLDR